MEYTVAAKVVTYCPMRFENYPLDLQYCPFQVGSYGHNESYMSFKLESLTRDDQQSISVLGYKTKVLSLPQQHQLWRSRRGNFTMTVFLLELKRKSTPYLIGFYLPSGLFVMVSWVISYFIN